MKAKYKVGDKLEYELDGAGQKELFKEIANIQVYFYLIILFPKGTAMMPKKLFNY